MPSDVLCVAVATVGEQRPRREGGHRQWERKAAAGGEGWGGGPEERRAASRRRLGEDGRGGAVRRLDGQQRQDLGHRRPRTPPLCTPQFSSPPATPKPTMDRIFVAVCHILLHGHLPPATSSSSRPPSVPPSGWRHRVDCVLRRRLGSRRRRSLAPPPRGVPGLRLRLRPSHPGPHAVLFSTPLLDDPAPPGGVTVDGGSRER